MDIDKIKVGSKNSNNGFVADSGSGGDHNTNASLNPFKFQEAQSWVFAKKTTTDKPILKRPFLRKGEGIARFYKGRITEPENSNPHPADTAITPHPPLPPERPFNIAEDPYLEMDSSFVDSDSYNKESFTEDDLTESNCNSEPTSPVKHDNGSNPFHLGLLPQDSGQEQILVKQIEQLKVRDDKELKLFELLEQMTEGQSFCSTSSAIKQFVNKKLDISPVPQDSWKNGHASNSNNSTPTVLSRNRNDSMSSDKSSTSGGMEQEGDDDDDDGPMSPLSPQVLQRVLQLVRDDSEKSNRIVNEPGSSKSSTEFQGALLTARTMELENEIKKFREQNKNVDLLREQWQTKYDEMHEAQQQFDQLKDRELRLIEDEKTRLSRKKERTNKLLTEHQTKLNSANATEDEVQKLKLTISQLQKEAKVKNSRFISAQTKLKEEVRGLQERNLKLQLHIEKLSNKGKGDQSYMKKSILTSASTNTTPQSNKSSQEDEPVYNVPSSPLSSPPLRTIPTTPSLAKASPDTSIEVAVQKPDPSEDFAADSVEIVLPNGDKETRYRNGTTKTVSASSLWTRVLYYNGDIRETREDGTIRYFYNESSTWHTTYPDGLEVVEFPSGQLERKNPNGVTEIIYSNGCVKHIYPCGKEECIFSDQTILRTERNGDKVLLMANGQKEYQTKDFRKRIYPDGTCKIVYSDGTQETRYPNGRVRMKDSRGKLIHDAVHPKESTH